ncbi:MAG TPA: hypothetical protein VJN93_12605 [Candidatus Acidoferrum sp.]|nr:hypothetical protein [Candidatus Acidoferrum sp.]
MKPWLSRTGESCLRFGLLTVAATFSLASSTSAYDYPLSPEGVRDAYFLGRRMDAGTRALLDQYSRHLPLPDQGPYISLVSLLTPYAQAVFRSWRSPLGYSAQQAEEDYRRNGDCIQVEVEIRFTATYSALRDAKPNKSGSGGDGFTFQPEDFWHDFKFTLSQNSLSIVPRTLRGVPIYDKGGFRGADVYLEYDTQELASEWTLLDVLTPDGHHVAAKFDLAQLR